MRNVEPEHSRRGANITTALVLLLCTPIPVAPSAVIAQDRTAPASEQQPIDIHIAEAARRFGIPQPWIRAVMEVESAGNPRAVNLGAAQAIAPALAEYRPTDPQIAWHLARFVEHVRQVPADPIVLRQSWLRAYDFATDRGAVALNDHARVNDPFAQVGDTQISVEVSSVIRASESSFRVAWIERRYENGQLATTERWTAILTVVIQPPRDAERLRANPLGVYVHAINWSRENAQ